MTKEVLLTISGLQMIEDGQSEPVELVTAGDYYFRNGKHYILYDEVTEGSSQHTRNVVKIGKERLEVSKKGLTNVHMVFEKDKKNLSAYELPFGSILVGIQANDVEIWEEENRIDVEVRYSLDVNEEVLADCHIKMNIQSRTAGNFRLQQ